MLTDNSSDWVAVVRRTWQALVWGGFILTMLCIFLPLAPRMPETGLDPSWMLGMNQAVAQGLVFGRDVIFTFGPYSAVYTQRYHPATDLLMLLGSAWLALGWLVAVWRLSARHSLLVCALGLVALLFMSRDQLLFSYCFLAALLVYQRHFTCAEDDRRQLSAGLSLALVFIPLGLLPLIKVSMLPPSLLTVVLAGGMLLVRQQWGGLLVALMAPLLALPGFWCLAGQPLDALPDYLGNSNPVITAYAEAMSSWGTRLVPLVYLLLCALIGALILWRGPRGSWQRLALLLLVAAYLFVSFKAGFVRQEGGNRELGALGGLLLALLLLLPLLRNILLWPVLGLSLLVCLYSASDDWRQPERVTAGWSRPYASAYQGVLRRWHQPQAYAEEFSRVLAAIGREHPLPPLQGTVDIYSYDQAFLLASGNRWAPRPVMQSYAAYAEPLLRRNAEYLASPGAADNVLFSIQFIDGKYPALEDGASWPQLLSRYLAYGYRDGWLLMRKRQQPVELLRGQVQITQHRLGEPVALPQIEAPLLARIRVQPTLLGKLVNLLFKTSPLSIEVSLKDGSQKRYKLVSGMAESEFLLSPLIQNTQDFAYLSGRDAWMLEGSQLLSLRIVPALQWLPLWRSDYQLELQAVELPYDSPGGGLLGDERAQPVAAQIQGQGNCPGGIDVLQVRPSLERARLISVSGWLAGNTDKGEASEGVFLQVQGADGYSRVYPAQLFERPDVNQYFHQPRMGPVGYQVKIDAADLRGDYQLSLLRRYQNRLELCQNIIRNLSLNKASGT
ncbi:MAG: hypothetical protein ACRCTL_14005 [Pseudomonas sp.]